MLITNHISASGLHKSQPTPSSKHPEPALLSSKSHTNQVTQILHTCEWGAPSPPARKAMVMRACTVTHMHGHSHTFTATSTCTGTLLTRPAYGLHRSSANPVHSSALRLRNISADLRVQPAYSKHLGGMGMASTTTASMTTSGGPAPVLVRPEGRTCSRAIGPEGPITVKPKGLTDLKARRPDGKPA